MAKYCPEKDGPALYLDCKECTSKLCDSFFCLIVGSRNFDNYQVFKQKMEVLLSKQHRVVIVSGGARGADAMAERYAEEKGYPCIIFEADWSLGKKAGFIRNRKMHEFISKQKRRGCVAFWDGKSTGTAQSFELAKQYDNPIRTIYV